MAIVKRGLSAKDLGTAVTVVTLAITGMAGMAAAQTAEEGVANFYSDKFQGKKTASGEVYDKNGLTASHKKLPYGTKVKVTNVDNGKSVVVTVNDRMRPSSPAVIDVTRRAAEELGFAKAGKAKVKLEVDK
jgi:rare lipoprotein A